MESKSLNILGLAAAGIILISAFLPYVTAEMFGISMNVSAIRGWEGIVLVLCGAGGGFLIFKHMKWAVIPAAIAILIAVKMFIQIGGLPGTKVGFGVYVTIAGAIAMIVASLKYWKE